MSPRAPQLFNPFPGLRSFTSEEKHLFFGREDQVGELLRRLRERRFLAVVGPSGSGKSSLVRAGLLPELHGGTMTSAGSHWEVVVMKPGGDPLTNLASALVESDFYDAQETGIVDQVRTTLDRSALGLVEAVRQSDVDPQTNTLVVVDQFEEIFRFREQGGQSHEEAAAFVKRLLEASLSRTPSIYVVLTMRSDYLGDCAQFRGLAQAVNDGEYLIPRLTRAQKRLAISGPIQVGGAEISKRLLTKLLNDLGDDPDQLPVLQHALMRTWDYWARDHGEGEPIDLRHYEATGGMQEALSRHADEVFDSLPGDADRRVAERVFKALTEKVDQHRGIRRPMRVENLTAVAGATQDEVVCVIQAYRKQGCTFLMPPEPVAIEPRTIIDISHESLMRIWQRLRRWVEEEAQSAGIYRRLVETAHLHAEGKAGLYHDPDLPIAQAWRGEAKPNDAWAKLYGGDFAAAMAFLDKSQEEAEREEREREAARQRELAQAKALAASQLRAARLLRRFAATVVVALIIAIGLSLWAFRLKNQADEQSHLAKLRALDAQQAQAKAQRQQGKTSLALAQTALVEQRHFESRMLAARALGFEPFGRTNLTAQDAEELPVLLDRESSDWRKATRIAQGELPIELSWVSPSLRQYDGAISALAMHPEGRWAATGGELDNNVSIWDLEKGIRIHALSGHTQDVEALAFSHDGSFLVSAGDVGDNAVIFWNTTAWTSDRMFQLNSEGVHAMAFSPDDRGILVGDEQGQLFRISLSDGTVEEFADLYNGQRIIKLEYSASGDVLVGADFNGTIRIHDPRTLQVRGAIRLEPIVESAPILFALSPDAAWLAASSRQHGASLWDITQTPPVRMVDLAELMPVPAEDGFRFDGVAVSDDGARLLLGWQRNNESVMRGFTCAVSVFDVTNPRRPVYRHHHEGHRDYIRTVAFVPRTHRYLSGDDEGLLLYRDADIVPDEIAALKGHASHARQLAFSPDGRWFVSTSTSKDAFLWNAETASIHAHLSAHGDRCRAAVFSQDSRTLYTTDSADRTVYVWDVATGRLRQRHTVDTDINSMDLHPGGEELVVSGPSFSLFFFKVMEDGTLTEAGSTRVNHLAFHARFLPDGKHLITAGGARRVLTLVVRGDDGQWAPTKVVAGIHEGNINHLSVDPVTGGAATASADGTVKLWTQAGDANIREETISLPGLTDGVTRVEFSSDGARLLTADSESVKLWDRNTGELLSRFTHPDRARAAIFSPDDAHVLTAADDGLLRLWYLGHEALFASWPNLNGTPNASSTESIDRGAFGLTFLNQGRSLAIGGGFPEDPSAVKIWNFDQNSFEHTLTASSDAVVTGIEASPDGRYLAVARAQLESGSANGNVSIWNLDPTSGDPAGPVILTENLPSIWVNWHPDGNVVVTTHLGGSVRLWSRQAEGAWRPAKQPVVTDEYGFSFRKAVFSRDGTRLFVGSRAHVSVYPFDPATQELGPPRKLSHNWGVAVAVAKDRPLLITGSPASSDARFWNADTLEPMAEPFRFDFRPLILNVSDDGRYLAAQGTLGRLTVLDISNLAAPISVLDLDEENGSIFRGSAFSPDGSLFACAFEGSRGFARVYRLDQNEGQDRLSAMLDVMEFTETDVAWADLRNMSLNAPRVLLPPGRAPHPYLGFLRDPQLTKDQASDRLFQHYLQQRREQAAYAVLQSNPEPFNSKNASALARYAVAQLRVSAAATTDPTPRRRRLAAIMEELESKLPPDKRMESKLLNEEWEEALTLLTSATNMDQATRTAMADRFLVSLERATRSDAGDGSVSPPPKPLALAGLIRLNLQETLERWSVESAARVITLRPGVDESMRRLSNLLGSDQQSILDRGAVWRYFPKDAPAPHGWNEPGFDDASWLSGPADIGFGGSSDLQFLKTTISRHENRMTYYFRHVFPLDAPPDTDSVRIHLQRDDGVALYLNGQEILRDNLPAGDLRDETPASETVGGQNESTYFTFTLARLPWRVGANTLAAEIHQSNPESTDAHFDLAIQASASLEDRTTARAFDWVTRLGAVASGDDWQSLLPAVIADQTSAVPEPSSPLAWVARARAQRLLRRPAAEREALERAVELLRHSEEPADWRRQRDLLRRLEEIYTDQDLTEQRNTTVSRILAAPSRPANRPPEQLDLTPFYNSSLYDPRGWLSERWAYAQLRELPETYVPVGGIDFDIRGIVQLESGVYEWEGNSGGAPLRGRSASAHSGRSFPAKIEGVPVGRTASAIHFLIGDMLNRAPGGTEIARLVFHYEDGTTETLPLGSGQNIRGLWARSDALNQVGADGLAWAGTDPETSVTRRLGRLVWRNPRPDRVVKSFDFVSTLQEAAPFLIAATVE